MAYEIIMKVNINNDNNEDGVMKCKAINKWNERNNNMKWSNDD